MNKTCTTCQLEKPLEAFGVERKGRYGRRSKCRECRSRTEKQDPVYRRQHYLNNLGHIRKRRKEYYHENAARFRQDRLDYYYNNKTAQNEYMKQYLRKRRINDPQFRLSVNMSSAIWNALRGNKNGSLWIQFVEYSVEELQQHLEKQFTEGMTWDNYGQWHIDHIKPRAAFSYQVADDPEFKKCWSLSNLRPLWAKDNMRKGAIYK